MKNLTKIFMAVAVAMFAFACVTDTTEDLGIKVEGQGGVELTLSLEESRTQLGEKVDGIYPLYWSKGDKISVNGVESGEAIINQSNPASAVFAIQEAESYAVAYPAAAAGQVLFAEKQNHVAKGDTFASGVSTMYGYGTDRSSIQLNHLTGVLKVGIKGEAKLAKAQISTIDRAPIAGAFDIDFATGELEATTASKDVIEYSFGEGLQLTSEAQYIYVAVPAGQYDELYITLYEQGNSGNIMYATVKAGDSKPLTAGNVREFKSAIVYAPNAQLYVINSVERLQAFKAAIESAEGLAIDAILTEDIDMTGVEWTPIAGENYTKTLVGNGYAIKGLTAPLFATTSASFKGVHLEGVNISTNDTPIMGALACTITATETVSPKVENCSVSGTFTVKNENYAPQGDDVEGEINYGGLVGTACGTSFDECVNGLNITINQIAKYDETNLACVRLGGIVGYCIEFGDVRTSVTNSTNNGEIKLLEKTNTNARAIIGGLVGHSTSTNYGAAFSGVNNKPITIDATMPSDGGSYVAGIIGVIGCKKSATDATTMTNTTNNGNIVVTGDTVLSQLHLGGVVAQSMGTQLDTVVNHGTITVGSADNYTTINSLEIGGIGGNVRDGDSGPDGKVANTTNNAPISVWNNSEACSQLRIAGVISWSQGAMSNITNTEKGDISVNGTLALTSTDTKAYSIAGLAGYKTSNSGTTCYNYGDITVGGTYSSNVSAEDAVQYIYVGGAGGRSHQSLKGENRGNITFTGDTSQATKASLYIGGSIGFAQDGKSEMENYGKVTISGNQTKSYIGGLIGWLYNGTSSKLYNHGNIEISATLANNSAMGGLMGYFDCTTNAKTLSESYNYGNFTFTGSVSGGAYIGGLIGRNYAKLNNVGNGELDATTNKASDTKGKITICPTVTAEIAGLAGTMQLGGCVGDNKGTVTTMNNYGDILISSTIETINIGGCINYNSGALTTVKNYGDITLDENTKTSYNIGIGGILRKTINSLTTVENHGNIYIAGNYTENAATDITVGGILLEEDKGDNDANLSKLIITGAKNYGNIEVAATVTGNDSGNHGCSIGGVAHHLYGKSTNLENHGAITFSGTTTNGKHVYIGGVLYTSDGTVEGTTKNEGSVIFSGESGANVYLGGVFYKSNTAVSNVINGALKEDGTRDITKGKISFTGAINKDKVASGSGTLYVGAITCTTTNANRTNCTNYGDILVNPSSAENQNIYNCFIGALCYDGGTNTVWTNCHNHGDITLGENTNLRNSPRIGGLIGKCESDSKTQTFVNCSNSGNISISGKTGVGLCNIGGLTGSMTSSQAIAIQGGFVNSGNITFNATHAATKNDVTLGGIVGLKTSSTDITNWEGKVVNTGKITYAGSCGRSVFVGGIMGQTTKVVGCTSFINTGEINCTGTYATSGLVGGIIGSTSHPISGAKCYATIYAIGYTGAGMITGSAYSAGTVEISNSAVGGKITATTKEIEDGNGDKDEVPMTITLSETSNIEDDQTTEWNDYWYKYIYGSGNPASAAEATGCSLLTSAPSLEAPAPEETPEA